MKIVLVTGASKGLGLALSKQLILNDYKVIGISRNEGGFSQLRVDNPSHAFFYSYDFSDPAGIAMLVKKIVKEHGRPYALVNNAAVGHDGVLATMHENDIYQLVTTNVISPIMLTKYVVRSMLLNNAGRIVNIGSIIGSTGFNGLSVYGASKSALTGFSKSLAREVGKANITVNTLAPGYMETSMTSGLQGDKLQSIKRRSPLGRLANVEDAASAVIFLLSDGAKSVTGTTITVDAGSTA